MLLAVVPLGSTYRCICAFAQLLQLLKRTRVPSIHIGRLRWLLFPLSRASWRRLALEQHRAWTDYATDNFVSWQHLRTTLCNGGSKRRLRVCSCLDLGSLGGCGGALGGSGCRCRGV